MLSLYFLIAEQLVSQSVSVHRCAAANVLEQDAATRNSLTNRTQLHSVKSTAKATQEFLKAKKRVQSPDHNLTEHFTLKSNLKAERPTEKYQLKAAGVKA